jgi:serine phosphatase RsbU (regulator of sigma subunit)
MLKINIKTPGKPPVTTEAAKLRMTIGRSVRNEICLEDPFASRLHAELRSEGDTYWLSDLGSANGSVINGQRITGTVQVFPGDRIQIGETTIELQLAGDVTRITAVSTTDRMPATEVVASPEVTKEPTDRPPATSGLLSVIETVRSAAGSQEGLEIIQHRKDLLSVLSKVSIELLSPSSLDEVLNRIIDLIFEGVPADRAFLLLREGTNGELKCKVASYRRAQPNDQVKQLRISQSITNEVVNQGQAILTSDAQQDERFRGHQSIVLGSVRSVMAVPLSVNQQVIGMIYVDSPMSVNVFTDDDLRCLTTIASVAAIKIENALLLEQRIDNERMKQQLNSARDIQSRLLPVNPPPIPCYDMTGISFPCFEVGGDYFDFIQQENDRLVITLGDVSGKGMDAAILMSSLHAAVRAQAETSASVSELVTRINHYLYQTTPANKFVTLFCGQLDCKVHALRYTNAGHNPPLLIRQGGTVVYLEAGGLPVGITEHTIYEEDTTAFEPGDVLIIYSDGISEALNQQGEEFTAERLIEVVQKNAHCGAPQLRDRIDEVLLQFMGTASPVDDMTLVIVKRTE